MKVYELTLTAGVPWELYPTGEYLRVLSGSAPMDIKMRKGGRTVGEAEGVVAGFGLHVGAFDYISIVSTSSQAISVAASEFPLDFQPVTLNTVPTQASGITDATPVTVGIAAGVLLAADANRKGFRAFNAGTVPVYLGSSGVTTANGAIQIAPGEMWVETDAAPAAWWAISGTAAQTVRVQTIQ